MLLVIIKVLAGIIGLILFLGICFALGMAVAWATGNPEK
jgi:flagellin-like protein